MAITGFNINGSGNPLSNIGQKVQGAFAPKPPTTPTAPAHLLPNQSGTPTIGQNIQGFLGGSQVQSKYGSSAPVGTQGGMDYATPQTPVKAITHPDGTKIDFPASDSGNKSGFLNTGANSSAGNQQTPPQSPLSPGGAAQNVLNVSQPSALGQGAAQASALYEMLGQERQLAPFAGGTSQGLLQSYANLTRPQSTGNLAGETGLFDVQKGILQNAANTTSQQALAQQGLQQQGAEAVAGLAQPQPYGITQTPYQPLTGQFGTMPGGTAGAFGAGQVQGNLGLGQQFQQTILPAYNAAGTVLNNTQQFLKDNPDLNSSNIQWANAADAYLRSGVFSDPKYPELSGKITEFLNTLTPVAGAAGEQTNFKQQLVNSMVRAGAQNKSLSEVLDNLYSMAGQKVESIRATGTGGAQPGTGVFNW